MGGLHLQIYFPGKPGTWGPKRTGLVMETSTLSCCNEGCAFMRREGSIHLRNTCEYI